MNEQQRKVFEQKKEVDFSFGVQSLSRYRANVFLQRGCAACAIRQIPYVISKLEELGLPPIVGKLTEKPNGLVLVTGPTGSGKSTTLAAMVDKINGEREGHILTIVTHRIRASKPQMHDQSARSPSGHRQLQQRPARCASAGPRRSFSGGNAVTLETISRGRRSRKPGI